MNDNEIIDLCAFRYALGRRTYIVDIVTRYLCSKLETYSLYTLHRFKEEIERAPSLGDQCDEALWKDLLDYIDDEIIGRDAREA